MVTPSTLIFFEVSALKITLDYATIPLAVAPISILEIHRNPFQYPNGLYTYQWRLALNYPSGEISFVARGFKQTARQNAVESQDQFLAQDLRTKI